MLAERCSICRSWSWCGRPCKNTPSDQVAHVNKATGVTAKSDLINDNAAHQAKWRAANPELNRQRAREGMRKLRANVSA